MSSLTKTIFSITGSLFVVMLSYLAYFFYTKSQSLSNAHNQLIELKEIHSSLLQDKAKMEGENIQLKRDILNLREKMIGYISSKECDNKIASNEVKLREITEKNCSKEMAIEIANIRGEISEQNKNLISLESCDAKNKDVIQQQKDKVDLECRIKLHQKEIECLERLSKCGVSDIIPKAVDSFGKVVSDFLPNSNKKVPVPATPISTLSCKPISLNSPPHLFVSVKLTTFEKETCLVNARALLIKQGFSVTDKPQVDGAWGLKNGYKGHILCKKQMAVFSVVGEDGKTTMDYVKQLKKDF